MSETLPLVTVVIAARPGQSDVKARAAAQQLDWPREKLEIVIARGTHPSVQRNAALKVAQGEWIYFLDDDSLPPADSLRRATPHLARPEVVMLGGPNLCPPEAPPLEQAFAQVMGCWLAFGPSRARYEAVGQLRESSEKELILCNLLARRASMLALGGFDEALYPNEENALMDNLQKQGGKLLYDPALVVFRQPRRSLRSFARMLLTYGRGRAEQVRRHPTLRSLPNFVPPLFCAYLLAAAGLSGLFSWGVWLWWALLPYGLAVGAQAAKLRNRSAGSLLRVVPLIILTHVLYGLGFWRGLFTQLKPAGSRETTPVFLERIQSP